jgi:hypothetical protein
VAEAVDRRRRAGTTARSWIYTGQERAALQRERGGNGVGGLERRQGARRKVTDENGGDRRGGDATATNHRRTATEKGDGDRVKWLDLRREPGSEMPDGNGGDGRVRDATGGEWTDNDGGGSGRRNAFEIQEEEPKEEGGGAGRRGKKKPAGQYNRATRGAARTDDGSLGYGIAIPYPGYRI